MNPIVFALIVLFFAPAVALLLLYGVVLIGAIVQSIARTIVRWLT